MMPTTTEISSSSSTNVRIRPGEYYSHEVFDWLLEGEDTVGENINERNDENINDKATIFKDHLKEELPQERFFEESYKGNYSQEESTQEEIGKTFRSSTGSSTSSLYTAELMTSHAHRSMDSSSSNGSNENEISSPIKPLKATTTPTTFSHNNSNSTSNVYEILQEIKPDHPLRIHTQFDFATAYLRPSPSSSISLNPLLHHHRNSTYNSSRNSIGYVPPRRYSNFQRQSLTSSFHSSTSVKRLTVENPPRVEETDNNFIIRQLPVNEKDGDSLHEETIMYGKYLFWAGFLFIPVWWVGSFHRPTSTEEYKWRKRCRIASSWSFIILIVVMTLIVIVDQRLKIGL